MQTRRATLSDLPALVGLFDGYRQFYRKTPDLPRAEQFLRDRLSRGDSVIFVAEHQGRLVGFTQLYPIFSSLTPGTAWVLNDLFVLPEVRKEGAGRALMECAERHGRQSGARWLSLSTERDNLTAQRLYESRGWVRDEEYYHYELDLEPKAP